MKRIVALALLFCTAISVSASPRHWYTDKKWWAGTAVIGAAVFLDMHSTAINRCNGTETNLLLGPHPSNGRLVGVGLAAFAYWTTVHAVDWHFSHDDPNRAWRVVGYTAMPVAALAVHLPAAIHNYELPAAEREGLIHPCQIPVAQSREGRPCR